LTDSESENTTIKKTVRNSSKGDMKQERLKKHLIARRAFDPNVNKISSVASSSNTPGSERHNSSSDSTQKNYASQYHRYGAKKAPKNNKNKENVRVNREILLSKNKHMKNPASGMEKRKISDYYAGKAYEPSRKVLGIKRIIQNLDTPTQSSNFPFNEKDNTISPINQKENTFSSVTPTSKISLCQYLTQNKARNDRSQYSNENEQEKLPRSTTLSKQVDISRGSISENSRLEQHNTVFTYIHNSLNDHIRACSPKSSQRNSPLNQAHSTDPNCRSQKFSLLSKREYSPPKANIPYTRNINCQSEIGPSFSKASDGLPPNPLYLMTNSSCEKLVTRPEMVKMPLTRNEIKDFSNTYLGPKMWPNSSSRLNQQRCSLMSTVTTPLKLNQLKCSSVRRIGQTAGDENEVPPLIFSNQTDYSTISGRKNSISDLKQSSKMARKVDQGMSGNHFMQRSNSAMPKSNSQRNFVFSKKMADNFELKNVLPPSSMNRKSSYATVVHTDLQDIKSRNSEVKSNRLNKSVEENLSPGRTLPKSNLVTYILSEIDKLDQIKKNL